MIVVSVTSSNKTLHRFDQITQKDSGNASISGGVINQISGSETKSKNFFWWMTESLLTLGCAKSLVPAQGHLAHHTVTPRSGHQFSFIPIRVGCWKGKKQN
jgi:hypothetical protein